MIGLFGMTSLYQRKTVDSQSKLSQKQVIVGQFIDRWKQDFIGFSALATKISPLLRKGQAEADIDRF